MGTKKYIKEENIDRRDLGKFAEKLRNNQTPAERYLFARLKGYYPDFRIYNQKVLKIRKYETIYKTIQPKTSKIKTKQYLNDFYRNQVKKIKTEPIVAKSSINLVWDRIIGNQKYIPDILIKDYKIIIETDGEIHNNIKNETHDSNRDELLMKNGYLVLRFKNEEVLNKIHYVLKIVDEAIKMRIKNPELKNKRVIDFFDNFKKISVS